MISRDFQGCPEISRDIGVSILHSLGYLYGYLIISRLNVQTEIDIDLQMDVIYADIHCQMDIYVNIVLNTQCIFTWISIWMSF
jgi:hypothetical protein